MLNINIQTSKEYAVVSDVFSYIIEIKNGYDFEIEDVIIKSILDEQLKFISGSVLVDNDNLKHDSIISGINLGEVKPNSSKVVKLDVEVINKKYDTVDINFLTEYKYKEQEGSRKFWESVDTKVKPLKINNPSLKIIIESDVVEVQVNEMISFTVKLYNDGDLKLYNMYLCDALPKNIEIVEGSFCIGNRIVNNVDINRGVLLGDLLAGDSIIIKYKAKVISGSAGGKIKNKVKVKYYFKLEDRIKSYKETSEYGVNISMDISNFKHITINNYLDIGHQKPKLQDIVNINAKAIIDRCSVIKTSKLISKEGSKLSGYKLIIHGSTEEIVEYESLEEISYIYSSKYETHFSTYIILPSDFVVGTNVEIDAVVDNISYNKINDKIFYRSIDLILIGKLRCY